MSKIGEGKELPKQPTVEQYHKDVETNASKFLNALESYKDASSDDKERLRPIMDQSLALIRAAVSEIKYAGIYKAEVKVENDYKAYMQNPNSDNLSALEQDLSTLRDYNKLT